MSLFQCDKCGVIENTALSFGSVGWTQRNGHFAAERINRGLLPGKRYCSQCWDGHWHGQFPQEFHPVGSMSTDREGNIHPTNKQGRDRG